MYVCMCVCVYVCVCVCVYVCMCMCVCMYVCMYVCVCVYVCMYVCMYVYMCMCVQNQQAGGMTLAAPGVSSSAGTAYYSPHAMGMGSNAQVRTAKNMTCMAMVQWRGGVPGVPKPCNIFFPILVRGLLLPCTSIRLFFL